jgi:hypothetical protein
MKNRDVKRNRLEERHGVEHMMTAAKRKEVHAYELQKK